MSRSLPRSRTAVLVAGATLALGGAINGPASAQAATAPSAAPAWSSSPGGPGSRVTVHRTGTATPVSPATSAPPTGPSPWHRVERQQATSVHVVAPTGDDAGPGTPQRPWRTLARASRAALEPGAALLLQRGATYDGGLSLSSSGTPSRPIVVGATGAGAAPVVRGGDCVRVVGDHVSVSGLLVRDCAWAGVSLEGAGDAVTATTATGNVVGVHVTESATGARVSDNTLVDNRRLSPGKDGPDDDSGVNGVLVQGTGTSVTGNRISGHHAPSPDYGTEGSAVEVYGARGTTISGNSSVDNSTFVELGDARTDATTISRNTVTSSVGNGYFLVTRGAGDSFGPVRGTVVDHNSVAMNGPHDGGMICFAGCSPSILTATDNVIVAREKPTWTDGVGMGGGNNVLVNDSDPRTARPLFVDRTRDLRLVATSPAVDSAGACSTARFAMIPAPTLGASHAWCRDGNGDGRSALDLGALER